MKIILFYFFNIKKEYFSMHYLDAYALMAFRTYLKIELRRMLKVF